MSHHTPAVNRDVATEREKTKETHHTEQRDASLSYSTQAPYYLPAADLQPS